MYDNAVQCATMYECIECQHSIKLSRNLQQVPVNLYDSGAMYNKVPVNLYESRAIYNKVPINLYDSRAINNKSLRLSRNQQQTYEYNLK